MTESQKEKRNSLSKPAPVRKVGGGELEAQKKSYCRHTNGGKQETSRGGVGEGGAGKKEIKRGETKKSQSKDSFWGIDKKGKAVRQREKKDRREELLRKPYAQIPCPTSMRKFEVWGGNLSGRNTKTGESGRNRGRGL